MFENIILGIIQGIAEWLPISSEGMIVLAETTLFNNHLSIETLIKQALFLHLGTFFAALIYLRKDVFRLLTALTHWPTSNTESRKELIFLTLTTTVSGILGILIMKGFAQTIDQFENTGKTLTLCVGFLLLITAGLNFSRIKSSSKSNHYLSIKDALILGVVQAFAVLPGLSRSGLTVAALLLLQYQKSSALKLSFLMSLPLVLAANIILNLSTFHFNLNALLGLLFSFIFGIITIHLLLKMAERINFGFLLLFFGLLTIIAAIL